MLTWNLSEHLASLDNLPSLSLAYLGDAVYELYVRGKLLSGGETNPERLHQAAVRYVNARSQARILAHLRPGLRPEEEDVVRRARNARPGHAPRGATVAEYHASTAFEALVGFLFAKDQQDRLSWIFGQVEEFFASEEK